jgi:hypothetical protein
VARPVRASKQVLVPLALEAGAIGRELQGAAQVGAHVHIGAYPAVIAQDEHGTTEEVDLGGLGLVDLGVFDQGNAHR